MIDAMKKINDMRKLSQEMEEKIANYDHTCNTKNITIKGKLTKVIIMTIDEKIYDNKNDLIKELIECINKYFSSAEDAKKKIMMENIGGMSGAIEMLKNIQGG